MELNFKSFPALLDYFAEEKTCHEFLVKTFWPNGLPVCPHCGSVKTYTTKTQSRLFSKKDIPGYRCAEKECAKKFTITTGTIFHSSTLPLRTWFAAIFLHTTAKKGISSLQLARQLGLTQKSAWYMLQRIREMFKNRDNDKLDGEVEIDETFVGGKYGNMTKKKRESKPDNKNIVLGMIQRGGKVVLKHLKGGRLAKEMIPAIQRVVNPGAAVYTDELSTYGQLRNTHVHSVIEHRMERYVNGRVHTQNIEGFWSILKRGIIGVYHYVSSKHLALYCSEFAFRYNVRELSTSDKFKRALLQSRAVRITYKQLIS